MNAPQSDRPNRPSANRPTPRALPRYRLILLSDRTQDLMHLVRSIMELTRFAREEATHRMWQAHHTGRSVLLQTHLERAELYAEQFSNRGLSVLVEPA